MKIGIFNRIGRYEYLWNLLKERYDVSIINKGETYDVLIYGLLHVDEFIIDHRSNCIVICGRASDWVKEHNRVISLLEDEEFLIDNARITAWGIIEILLRHSMQCLSDIGVDVIGYGRCGKEIVKLFDALGVRYRVITRSNKYDIPTMYYEEYLLEKPNAWIIQTAENCIFDKIWVGKFGNSTCIIDITTQFLGTQSIQNELITILYAKALPDIYCSKSGAVAYYQAIQEVLLCV